MKGTLSILPHFFCTLRNVQLHPSSFLRSGAKQDIAQRIRDCAHRGSWAFSLLSSRRESSWSQRSVLGDGRERQAGGCGRGSAEKVQKSQAAPCGLQNLHSVGIWGQVVAVEVLKTSRCTGSSRLALVVLVSCGSSRVPVFAGGPTQAEIAAVPSGQIRTVRCVPDDTSWRNTFPYPLYSISTLLTWQLIRH